MLLLSKLTLTSTIVIFNLISLLMQIGVDVRDIPKPKAKEWKIKGALAALEDSNREVRILAMWTLEELESLDRISNNQIRSIVDKLESEDSYVIENTIHILGKMGESSKDYIPKLIYFLENEDESIASIAANAIGNLGELSKDYIPQIAGLLENDEWRIRSAAIEALGNLGELSRDYVPQIADFLKDENEYIRISALNAIGNLGELSKDYIPQIAGLLENDEWRIRRVAAEALGNLGELSRDYVPQIADFLEVHVSGMDPDLIVKVLGEMGEFSKDYIPKIVVLLKDEHWYSRYVAVTALGNLGGLSKAYLPQIATLLEDEDENVRYATVIAMDSIGLSGKEYFHEIEILLQSENRFISSAAARVLKNNFEISEEYISQLVLPLETKYKTVYVDGVAFQDQSWIDPGEKAIKILENLGELSKDYVPLIAELVKDRDLYTCHIATEALGNLGKLSEEYIPYIADILKRGDSRSRSAAITALGNLGELSISYIPEIVTCLGDGDSDESFEAELALHKIGEVEFKLFPFILYPIYCNTSLTSDYRFLAHFVGAGKDSVEILLKWLGNAGSNKPVFLSHDEAHKTLQIFYAFWDVTANFPNIRSDLAEQIAVVISRRNINWKRDDLPLLKSNVRLLESVNSTHVDALLSVISSIEDKRWTTIIFKIWLIHVIFWIGLIFFYPKSQKIQAIFFWNPYIRRIASLGYITFFLMWLPYLRRKLFEPFRESLLSDALLDDFDMETYYEDVYVKDNNSQKLLSIKEAIPYCKGKIILEGESGFGKTMYVRNILKHSKRVAIYLNAERCSIGVLETIQNKLHGIAKDTDFLQTLIYSGAIDIYIDGLNEVNAENRANIVQFLETYYKGNFIITTQPIDWAPPPTAKTFVLQPLRSNQIEHFLISRKQILSNEITNSNINYEHECKKYVAKNLDESLSKEELNSALLILSNPMDLVIIAEMLAHNQEPNLFRLHEQQFQIMAKEYKRVHNGRKFPLSKFSEFVYQMRLNDEVKLPADEFIDEINCMERYKIVLSRSIINVDGKLKREWIFRHDKIMEFFIVQTFLGNSNRPLKHLSDPRFQGVYFLLASFLPFDAALRLREKLIQYAADTKDHFVSDKFIKLLRSRKSINQS